MPTDNRSQDVIEHRTVPWRDVRPGDVTRPDTRDITITDVKTTALSGNFIWGLVKIETDADFYGLGEVYSGRATAALELAADMGRYITGNNPLDVNALFDTISRNYADIGGGLTGQAALTGVETALWDIKGKHAGLPIYELFGGKYRSQMKMYCDTHAGEALSSEATADPETLYTPEAYAKAAREVVDEGFEALKFDLDVVTPGHPQTDAPAGRMANDEIDHKVSLIEGVRDEIGHDIDLGVDLHWNYSVETSTRLSHKLDPFDLAWIEDPVSPTKTEAHKRVRNRISTPLLTGENIVTAGEFNKMVAAEALDIAAPDVAKCGGLGELRRIATVCDLYGVPLAPHNIASPVGTVAGVHACASIPNVIAIEYHAREVPWWEDLVTRTDGAGPILEDGFIRIPEGPGLGIDINADIADEHLLPGFENIF